jgi:hypothetical protein
LKKVNSPLLSILSIFVLFHFQSPEHCTLNASS